MERIKELDRYQKVLLLLLIVMALVFCAMYIRVTSRVGILYHDVILALRQEDEAAVYSGTIKGQECCFTVTADKTVTFQYGEKIYGPYIAREDPTAKPEDMDDLTGVEIREGDAVFFRGGVRRNGDSLSLFDENGKIVTNITVVASNGVIIDSDGNVVDQMAPSANTVLQLMDGPELTSKGNWVFWFGSLLISLSTAVSILFADGLFRFRLSFRVRNVAEAEPADWELTSRYIGWTVMTFAAFFVYAAGLG